MKEDTEKDKNAFDSYLRYSGIGFQLAGSIALGVLIGYELDKWLKTSGPYFTLGFSLIFMVVGFYLAFRDFFKKK